MRPPPKKAVRSPRVVRPHYRRVFQRKSLQIAIINLQSSVFPIGFRSRVSRNLPRAAFTLVELLAALGISLLLIAAVSASIDIYLRVTTTGQVAIERQQVTRALLDQLTRDISSIVYWVPESTDSADATSSTDSGSSSSSSSSGSNSSSSGGSPTTTTTTTTTTVQDPETAYTTTSLGLVGDSQSLLLHISRPVRDLNYTPAQNATSVSSRTSDLLSVQYFLAQPGADGLAGEVSAQRAQTPTDPAARVSTGGPAGLARLEADEMAMDHAEVEMDTAALATAAQVIAPEIAAVQFRYYDGQAWVEAWDSTAMESLPLAIEITLSFRDSEAEARTPVALAGVAPIGLTVRHVIAVPLAVPAEATEAP